MTSRIDVMVLGAGIVGICVALHLQKRARSVVLVDRRGAAEETSFGNAGLIQREGVYPVRLPARLRRAAALRLQPHDRRALPSVGAAAARAVPVAVLEAFAPGAARRGRAQVREADRALRERARRARRGGRRHRVLPARGWMKVFRTERERDKRFAEAERWRRRVRHQLPRARCARAAGSRAAPRAGAVGRAALDRSGQRGRSAGPRARLPAALRAPRRAGSCRATRASLEADGTGWRVRTAHGPLAAGAAVIALGPWADVLTQALGYDLPLAVKRGYHMHYRPAGEARLNHPVLDTERGYFLAPMRHGIRLTTGAEFALPRRDQDAGAARPRRADRARSLSARRAPRHRAVDGRAPVHAGHAADHRQSAAARQSLVRVRPRAPRAHARPRDRAAARRDDHRRADVRRSGAVLGERFG